ncbi:YdcF family protein [Waterburya agarophytonicola K14]|uniref:YdcF family protein n=1 Tax=Waterburya agarophytonicola KI4 TaxID=2874699 RepID=A0A964BP40_9CYAN|nr:YdcF family protein [Waterburya agarophytonicola]MCC0176988.1 YdcF family protein [Waterburya agarophytonicola KI4]
MFLSFQSRDESKLVVVNPIGKLRRLILLSVVATSLCVGFKPIHNSVNNNPEALLVLGGHEERERFAAKLAQEYPDLPIWISSGSPQEYAQKIFAKAGIESDRLHFDYRARDTVTNFTTLVDELKAQGIDSVYLITSENHMTRAKIIGDIVFGSQGIDFKPIAVPSKNPPEPLEKCLRDGARSIIWTITGHTGVILLQSGDKSLKFL